jgi:chemotaxis response regulator CheB
MQSEGPLIGVICEPSTSVLAGRIQAAGYRIVRVSPPELRKGTVPEVGTWVIDCPDNFDVARAMDWLGGHILALSNRPDLSQLEDYQDWSHRVIKTLDKWNADYWHANSEATRSSADLYEKVEAVWMLAGSTGGVEAVFEFFASFTHVPPVSFIYAQHIQADQQDSLTAIGHANPDLSCALAVGRHWLNPGQVLIVPATCQLRFSSHGEVFCVRDPWSSMETPSINEIMMTMSGMQPTPAGSIIFSGAGRDGGYGLKALHSMGAQTWVQSPDSCAAPSMPQHAIDLGLVSRKGSPRELAEAFMRLYPAK